MSRNTIEYKIVTEVTNTESRYDDTPVTIVDGLSWYHKATIRMCEFYSNSKYLEADQLKRYRPFRNIVNYRVTLAKVATDLDVKDILISSDEPKDWVRSMFLQHESYKWMKETNFAYFLNKMGQVRPKYGGVLVKKNESDGDICIDVVDWRNVTVDQVDILGGTIIEKHYLTPVELSKKKDVWNFVKEAIKEFAKSTKGGTNWGEKDESTNRIEVKEVHGWFPISFLKQITEDDYQYDVEDDYEFSLQRHFYAKINEQVFMFNSDEEKELPYDYLAWEEMPGRGLGRGVIEDSEEAQVATNDAVINEKRAMDLAGKVGIKTDSKKIGNNILEHDHGKIYQLEEGKMLETFQLVPAALGQFQNQINAWKEQADLSTSSQDAITGETPSSGTPYSQTALLNQVASKPFDYRREEAGIFITRLFEKWIIPNLVKRLTSAHMLASEFSDDELEAIDNSFAASEANKHMIEKLTQGLVPSPDEYHAHMGNTLNKMSGSKRYIQFPAGYFTGVAAKVTVVTTNEQKNKAAVLQSLSTILQTVQGSFNPNTGSFGILENPTLSRIFGTIIELSGAGISPASLGLGKTSNAAPTGQQTALPPTPVASPLPAQAAPVAQ